MFYPGEVAMLKKQYPRWYAIVQFVSGPTLCEAEQDNTETGRQENHGQRKIDYSNYHGKVILTLSFDGLAPMYQPQRAEGTLAGMVELPY